MGPCKIAPEALYMAWVDPGSAQGRYMGRQPAHSRQSTIWAILATLEQGSVQKLSALSAFWGPTRGRVWAVRSANMSVDKVPPEFILMLHEFIPPDPVRMRRRCPLPFPRARPTHAWARAGAPALDRGGRARGAAGAGPGVNL